MELHHGCQKLPTNRSKCLHILELIIVLGPWKYDYLCMQYKTSSKEKDDLKYILRESDGYKASLKTESSKKNTLSHTTTSDKTLETNLPIFQYQRHSWTQREIYKLPPSLAPYSVVLARMLAYTNPVVFKTTLKEGRGEGRYYRSSLRGFIKNNRKIRACFQFVSSGFVRGCWLPSSFNILTQYTTLCIPSYLPWQTHILMKQNVRNDVIMILPFRCLFK